MNSIEKWKQQIQNTTLCTWQEDLDDSDGGYYLVSSPLTDRLNVTGTILGCSPDKQEAIAIFNSMLDDALEDYRKGVIAPRKTAGKPQKGKVRLSAEVTLQAKTNVRLLGNKLGGLSYGETVEFLMESYRRNPLIEKVSLKSCKADTHNVSKKRISIP
jgi:hypothetical protein